MKIYRATLKDSKDIWTWRNDPQTRRMFRSSDFVDWELHSKWFKLMLKRTDQFLLIGCDNQNEKVGMVRFDFKENNVAEISINLNPKKRGLKIAKPLLTQAIDYGIKLGIKEFIAEIKNENHASLYAFKGVGFEFVHEENEMSLFKMTYPKE
jgi:RimJ/RimL family protein N-acetyltransferase